MFYKCFLMPALVTRTTMLTVAAETLQAQMHEDRGSRTMLALEGPFLNWT